MFPRDDKSKIIRKKRMEELTISQFKILYYFNKYNYSR